MWRCLFLHNKLAFQQHQALLHFEVVLKQKENDLQPDFVTLADLEDTSFFFSRWKCHHAASAEETALVFLLETIVLKSLAISAKPSTFVWVLAVLVEIGSSERLDTREPSNSPSTSSFSFSLLNPQSRSSCPKKLPFSIH